MKIPPLILGLEPELHFSEIVGCTSVPSQAAEGIGIPWTRPGKNLPSTPVALLSRWLQNESAPSLLLPGVQG